MHIDLEATLKWAISLPTVWIHPQPLQVTSAELTVKLVYSGGNIPDICSNLSLVLVSPQLALHSSGREMSLLHTGRREEGNKVQ